MVCTRQRCALKKLTVKPLAKKRAKRFARICYSCTFQHRLHISHPHRRCIKSTNKQRGVSCETHKKKHRIDLPNLNSKRAKRSNARAHAIYGEENRRLRRVIRKEQPKITKKYGWPVLVAIVGCCTDLGWPVLVAIVGCCTDLGWDEGKSNH